VGVGLRAGVTAPLVALGVSAFKAGEALDRSMANVQSLGLTQERVLELKRGVQEAAIATGTGTDVMAAGLYQVVSAYGDSADTLKILELNAKAAKAGVASVEESIALTSAITKGYGDTSFKAIEAASDLSLTIVKLGQTDFPQLAASMGRVVPLAVNLGVTQQELGGTLATLTGVTGTAAEVSTQLRGTLQALSAPTAAMTRLLEEQGFASGEAMVQELGLSGSFLAIAESAKATGKPLQAYMGSIEGQTAALTLTGAQLDTFVAKMEEMGDVSGATNAAFLAQTDGINANGFATEMMKVKLQVLMQNLATGLVPALTAALSVVSPFIDRITALATRFAELEPAQQKNIVKFLAIGAAVGPVVAVVGGLTRGVGGVIGMVSKAIPFLGGFAAVNWATLAPILAIVAGAALLAAGVAVVIKHWDKITEFFAKLWEGLKGIFASAIDWIKEKVNGFVSVVQGFLGIFGRGNKQSGIDEAMLATLEDGAAGVVNSSKNPGMMIANSIDDYMPHSNARKGPLAKLTESGSSIVETLKVGADKKRLDLSGPLGLNRGDETASVGSTVINIDHLTVQSEDAEDIFSFVRLLKVAGGVA